MSTWFTGRIAAVIDDATFDIDVEQRGGPYSTDLRSTERIRFVNNEVSSLRPSFSSPYQQQGLIGRRIHCEIHSRSPMQLLIVTARPL
jgi:hypothetical protein